jgi:O-methyltransferase
MENSTVSAQAAHQQSSFKLRIRERVPLPILALYRLFRKGNGKSLGSFLLDSGPLSFRARITLVRRIYRVSSHVRCQHSEEEILQFCRTILSIPPDVRGCIVEAGCFKGGSTAKFSLASSLAGRELVVFDSFEGIPENTELHDRNIWGGQARFRAGDYRGTLEEVEENVREFGALEVCCFIKGWFDLTMPQFSWPVAAIYLDVDLASSTSTCLKYLWPLLVPGGYLFSQDGHLPLVLEVLNDDQFWKRELNTLKPVIHGFGASKLIWCRKELSS